MPRLWQLARPITEKVFKMAIQQITGSKLNFSNRLDSKDLFDTLTTCHTTNEISIRRDVSCIRYEFETHHAHEMTCIPGNCNLTDPLSNLNSPLEHALKLLMFEEYIRIELANL